MLIKRTKTKTAETGELVGKPAVHWVKKLAKGPAGAVDELTADRAEACEVSLEEFDAVKAFHAGKKFGGEFTADGGPVPAKPAKAEAFKADVPKG